MLFKSAFSNKFKLRLALLSSVSVLLFFQNCGEINLRNQVNMTAQPPANADPVEPISSEPSLSTEDPLAAYIIPGAPAPQHPGVPNLTPDTQGVHAGLYYYNLSQLPEACDLDTKVVQGWENASYQSNDQVIDPEYNDLANPSLANLPEGSVGSFIADHDIRFLRPAGPSILAFRIRTPATEANFEALVASQAEGRLTHTLLGCNFTNSCEKIPVTSYVSISTSPCDFSTAKTCTFDYSGMSRLKISDNSSNVCDLKPDKIYYLNVKFPYSVVDPNVITGQNYRAEVKIKVYK